MSLANRRSVTSLFSGKRHLYSHQVRLVLAEKGIEADIIDVDQQHIPEDILKINPYNTLPTLVDRDLVLYEPNIIMEYLDERFPYPPLLPVYPVMRAKIRLFIFCMQRDWMTLYHRIEEGDGTLAEEARSELTNSLVAVGALFTDAPFLLNDEFSLVDCYIAPLLWRLPSLNVSLPSSAKAITDYAERIFARQGFQQSLTDAERELR